MRFIACSFLANTTSDGVSAVDLKLLTKISREETSILINQGEEHDYFNARRLEGQRQSKKCSLQPAIHYHRRDVGKRHTFRYRGNHG